LFGIQILWRSRRNSNTVNYSTDSNRFDSGDSDPNNISDQAGPNYTINNIIGDIRRKFDKQGIQKFFSSNVLGDTFLDFSGAKFLESPLIRVNGVFGDVDIRVPKNFLLKIKSSYVAGSSQIFETYESGIFKSSYYTSPDGDEKRKTLTIEISIVFGDILIRN
jgi:predicted membrane protein